MNDFSSRWMIVPRGTSLSIFIEGVIYSCCVTILASLFSACSADSRKSTNRPNILWIVAEDLSPVIPSFGDSTIETPNLSWLASQGICYDRVFSPSGVCAPSRAAIATGMYPTHIGANHMRTGPWFADMPRSFIDNYHKNSMPEGLRAYEAVPPPEVKMMSEYLRAHGYYCTNNSKEDYQFKKSLMAWDESSRNAHWKNRKEGQPFFSIFNIGVTHESQIWAKARDSLWVDETLDVSVPPYLPDTDTAKIDIRRMYSNIKEMDQRVGEIIEELRQEKLLENTVIFWYSDHGGPLPRQKRLTYDSGLRVPMIIKFPDQDGAGSRDGQLVSFIDFAPTVLSLAGIPPPDHLDGRAFLGQYAAQKPRDYIHAASDRFDETPADRIRTVRDQRYKYIRYYDTDRPMFFHVKYRDQMPIMRELYRLRDQDQLNPSQALWFRSTKPKEELFDTKIDPHEVNNLADRQEYTEVKNRLSTELDQWLVSFEDMTMIPETELLKKIWPNGIKPVTDPPKIERNSGNITLKSPTNGASIGFKIFDQVDSSKSWNVYTGPFLISEKKKISAVAHRLGYTPSPMIIE